MKKVLSFLKDYWITILIYICMVLLYIYISDNKLLSPFLFPPAKNVWIAKNILKMRMTVPPFRQWKH